MKPDGRPVAETRPGPTPIAIRALARLEAGRAGLTGRQRLLAEYVSRNPEAMAFRPIADLAREAGVSQATIVRFCHALGYQGFSHLAREVQEDIQVELGTAGRFKLVQRLRAETPRRRADSAFVQVVGQEMDNLARLTGSITRADFYAALDLLGRADRVCLIGCLASASLAAHFGYVLAKILPRVDVLDGQPGPAASTLRFLGPESAALAIAFPRYPRRTIELARLAAARGARLIALTDSHLSPISRLAELTFFVEIGPPSFVDAYAAPLVFINALVTELAERDPARAQKSLSQYDQFALEADLFYTQAPRGPKRRKD